MARTAIAEFGVIQKALKNAIVSIYVADEHGRNTGVLATLYQATTGPAQLTNPQMLDENGMLTVDVWVEDFVVAEISGISAQTERMLLKIRANPLTYPLPLSSSGKNSSDIINAKDDAEAAAATATAQAVIATAQASTATTQANTATTQAGIATTQAGTATTKAAEASVSAAQAQAAAAGMKRKNPARAATTAALPSSTYANGTAGVGATLTATANGAFPAQDGVTLLVGEALLVKNESTQAHNGIYTLTNAGSAGTAWVLTRQTDSDTWDEIVAAVLTVTEGSTQADLDYLCTSNAGGTMGTTAITWQAYNTVIADGAVSTAAKILDGIITFAKMAASSLATTADLIALTANKIATAASIGPLFYGCSCTQTTTTTVPNNGLEIILFDGTDEYDDDGWHNPLSNSSRITVNFSGRVELTVNVGFASTGNGRHDVYIYKNGVSYSVLSVNVNAGPCYLSLVDTAPCEPGDYFQAAVLQSTGASRLTDTSLTKFKARRVR